MRSNLDAGSVNSQPKQLFTMTLTFMNLTAINVRREVCLLFVVRSLEFWFVRQKYTWVKNLTNDYTQLLSTLTVT